MYPYIAVEPVKCQNLLCPNTTERGSTVWVLKKPKSSVHMCYNCMLAYTSANRVGEFGSE